MSYSSVDGMKEPAPASYNSTSTELGMSGARMPKATTKLDKSDARDAFFTEMLHEATETSRSSVKTTNLYGSSPQIGKGFTRPPPVDVGSNPPLSVPPPHSGALGEARAVNDGQSVTVSASATGGATAHATGTLGPPVALVTPAAADHKEDSASSSFSSEGHAPAAQFRVNTRAAQVQAENMPPINPDNTLNKFNPPVPDTELSLAMSEGDATKIMWRRPSELTAVDKWGNTLLIWAADSGHFTCVKYLLEQTEVVSQINHRGFLGNTAISRAARGGHVECVRALLMSGAIDPNIPNDKKQYPLHFAAFKNHPECVQALVVSGKCDFTVRDRKGRIPAEDCSNPAIISMLTKAARSPQLQKGSMPGPQPSGSFGGGFGSSNVQGAATKQPPMSPLRSPNSKSGPPSDFFGSGAYDDSDFGISGDAGSPKFIAESNATPDMSTDSVLASAPASPRRETESEDMDVTASYQSSTNSIGLGGASQTRTSEQVMQAAGMKPEALAQFMRGLEDNNMFARQGPDQGPRLELDAGESGVGAPGVMSGVDPFSVGPPLAAPAQAPAPASAPALVLSNDSRALPNYALRQQEQQEEPLDKAASVTLPTPVNNLTAHLHQREEHQAQQLEHYKHQLALSTKNEKQLQETIERLRSDLEAAHARVHAEREESSGKIEALRRTHAEENTKRRAHQDHLERETERAIGDLKEKLFARDEEIAELKEEMADTTADNTGLTEQLQTRTQALHALQSEHDALLKAEEERRGELMRAQFDLQSALNKGASETNDVEALKAHQGELEDALANKENLVDTLRLQLQKLQDAFDEEKDSLQQSVHHFRGEYESELKRSREAETRYTQLQHFADTKDAECAELQAEIERAIAGKHDSDGIAVKGEEAQVSQAAHDAQAEALSRANDELDTVRGELQAVQIQKGELEVQLSSLTSTGGNSEPPSPHQPVPPLHLGLLSVQQQQQQQQQQKVIHSPEKKGAMEMDIDIESRSLESAHDVQPHGHGGPNALSPGGSMDSGRSGHDRHGAATSLSSASGPGSLIKNMKDAVGSLGLGSRSLDYGETLPDRVGENDRQSGGPSGWRRGSGSSTGSGGGERRGSGKSARGKTGEKETILPTHLDSPEPSASVFSPATQRSRVYDEVYDEQMEHIAKQEEEIKGLKEEVSDLTAMCKEKEQQISDLKRDFEGGGELGLSGHDEQEYLHKQNEENHRKRIKELEEEVALLLGKAQDELDARPDAAIRIRRQESVEAIEQLEALRIETDGLRTQLGKRREDDLNSLLNHHATQPQGFLQVVEFLAKNAPAYSSLLDLYVRAIYKLHNPAKLEDASTIPRIIESYAGEEQQLVDELYERYSIVNSDGGKEASRLVLEGEEAPKVPTDVGASKDSNNVHSRAISSASEAALSSQKVSNLFWSAVAKSTILALLLANGAFMVTQAHYASGSCTVDSLVRLAT